MKNLDRSLLVPHAILSRVSLNGVFTRLTLIFFCFDLPPGLAIESETTLLDGTVIRGQAIKIADRTVTVSTSSGDKSSGFEEIAQVEIKSQTSSSKSRSSVEDVDWLTLVDGSRIACKNFVGKDDHWKASTAGGRELRFLPGSVDSLQFGKPGSALAEQWKALSAEARTEDQLAIVRPGDTVDMAPGLVGELTAEHVEFSFDGQMIQAPRKKLLGVLWYRARNTRVEPTIRVELIDGSRWEATELKTDEANGERELLWKSRSGVEAGCAWNEVASIDFSVANVIWLAAEPQIEASIFQREWLKVSVAGRDKLLAPRFVSSEAEAEEKSKDLSFSGPGKIAFRTPEGFPKLVSRIHRSESSKVVSSVICEVWDGDNLAWSHNLLPSEQETSVEVPVTAGKKLTLVVRSESELMMGTKVLWDQPRLTR